ncbi:cyclic pyranopterin monophosphate synthase MoaC [Carboxylicivirga sp. N1Y90]|uniref:cyclic pyranopterin monophosphate synthase MoaC n=1 Tax=Carboxylicivirga fragile TaxID=3417571 RepID=UPI003D33C016|nr:cyclic pyranopterin monophosphate synthase MoaC [Marinilabiliaceae bacterium N1Y90]
MKNKLSHIDKKGKANMVDVGDKAIQKRSAKACGFIQLNEETLEQIKENNNKKGDVLTVAEIAGIQAAKRCSDLIPLCHTLLLSKVAVTCELKSKGVYVHSEVKCKGETGVEMEALTAVNVALLTVYDMCKAVDKNMVITDIKLLEKKKK